MSTDRRERRVIAHNFVRLDPIANDGDLLEKLGQLLIRE